MIAGETIAVLSEQEAYDPFLSEEGYDPFFRRRKKKRRKRKRSKAERKAKRKKFWKNVGDTIGDLGGFEAIGSAVDKLTTPKQTLPINDSSLDIGLDKDGIRVKIDDDKPSITAEKDKKKKSNRGMLLAIGGVVVLALVIGGALYMRNKQIRSAVT